MSERPLLCVNRTLTEWHYGSWRDYSLKFLEGTLAEYEMGLIHIPSHQIEALELAIRVKKEQKHGQDIDCNRFGKLTRRR